MAIYETNLGNLSGAIVSDSRSAYYNQNKYSNFSNINNAYITFVGYCGSGKATCKVKIVDDNTATVLFTSQELSFTTTQQTFRLDNLSQYFKADGHVKKIQFDVTSLTLAQKHMDNITVHIDATLPTINFEIKTTKGGSVTPSRTITVPNPNESAIDFSIQATADEFYKFNKWRKDNVEDITQNPINIQITPNSSLCRGNVTKIVYEAFFISTFTPPKIFIGKTPIRQVYIGNKGAKAVYIGTKRL